MVANPTPLRITSSDFRYYKNLDAWQQYYSKGQPVQIVIVCEKVVLHQEAFSNHQAKKRQREKAKDPMKGRVIDILA